jgi:hypothetical protein
VGQLSECGTDIGMWDRYRNVGQISECGCPRSLVASPVVIFEF